MNQLPILQQQPSKITTNSFIPQEQRVQELQVIEEEANKLVEEAYLQNKTSSIKYQSLDQINKNISSSVIGVIDDLLNKPHDIYWNVYILQIFQKDQRYAYIGILLVVISGLLYLFKSEPKSNLQLVLT
jgi:hypothetical protein